ncbi:MAG: glycosyltransferase, partial [Pseudomonadota bacterium]
MGDFNYTILQVIPELDAGGAEQTTLEIVQAVVDAGGRALVATAGGRLCGAVRDAGGEVFEIPVGQKSPIAIWRNARRLRQLIADEGVDLVHARSRAAAWAAERAARQSGVPFVTTYHGAYSEKNRFKKAYNAVMARGDIVIANSQFTANLIRERYNIDEDRLVVIPRGVDLERFNRDAISEERIAALRDAWGVTAGDRIILLPARLTRWKGQVVAIEAFSRAVREGLDDNVQLILAGDAQGRDDYVSALQSAIAENGVARLVKLVGHCSDMPA